MSPVPHIQSKQVMFQKCASWEYMNVWKDVEESKFGSINNSVFALCNNNKCFLAPFTMCMNVRVNEFLFIVHAI